MNMTMSSPLHSMIRTTVGAETRSESSYRKIRALMRTYQKWLCGRAMHL